MKGFVLSILLFLLMLIPVHTFSSPWSNRVKREGTVSASSLYFNDYN